MTANCPVCGNDWRCRFRMVRCPACTATSHGAVVPPSGWILLALALAADVALLALVVG